jgi:uncharacterized surface protein with fasciclin (FAS1) repeats
VAVTAGGPDAISVYTPINEAKRLCITSTDGGVTIADVTGAMATVIVIKTQADNGVSHVIDKILLPVARPSRHEVG